MISQAESLLQLSAAAAISTAMLGVGLGAIGPTLEGREIRHGWLTAAAGVAGLALFLASRAAHEDGGRTLLLSDAPSILAVGLGASLVAVIGGTLIAVGLRGRRVGERPSCRHCRVDLTLRPAVNRFCAACGEPIDVLLGDRVSRRVPLLIGAFLLIVGVGVGIGLSQRSSRSGGEIDPLRTRSVSLVLSDLDASAADTRRSAMNELDRRVDAGLLSNAETDEIVAATGTTPGADSERAAWRERFILRAWRAGQIDATAVAQLLRLSGARATLAVPAYSEADRIPISLDVSCPLAGDDGLPGLGWSIELLSRHDAVNGNPVLPAEFVNWFGEDRILSPTWPARGDAHRERLILDGAYRFQQPMRQRMTAVEIRLRVAVTLFAPSRPPVRVEVPLTTLGTTTVQPTIPPPATTADSRWAEAIAIFGPPRQGRPGAPRRELSLWPKGIAFVGDIFVRDDAGERLLCETRIRDDGRPVAVHDALPSGPFSLILRPRAFRASEIAPSLLACPDEIVLGPERIRRGEDATR